MIAILNTMLILIAATAIGIITRYAKKHIGQTIHECTEIIMLIVIAVFFVEIICLSR